MQICFSTYSFCTNKAEGKGVTFEIGMQCVRKFNEVLTQEPQVDSETDQEAQVEAQAAWRKEMLAQLRSFVRRFYTSFAPFAEEIQSTVFDRSVSGDKDREVKDAYLQSLAL